MPGIQWDSQISLFAIVRHSGVFRPDLLIEIHLGTKGSHGVKHYVDISVSLVNSFPWVIFVNTENAPEITIFCTKRYFINHTHTNTMYFGKG